MAGNCKEMNKIKQAGRRAIKLGMYLDSEQFAKGHKTRIHHR